MESSKLIEYPGTLSSLIYNAIISLGKTSNLLWGVIAVAFTLVLFYLTFYRNDDKKFFSSSLFYLFIASLGILLLRLPAICAFELNTDESEWITGAATLLKDFRFWHSVNGMTSGPLVIYPLCLIKIFGFSFNYANLRIFALLFCIFPVFIFVFKSFKIIYDEQIAKIIVIPLFVFLAMSEHFDLIAYNGEHIPMLLLTIAFYLFVKTFYNIKTDGTTNINLIYYFLCGILIGAMPYSKLQSSPIAFSFFIGMIAVNILSKEKPLVKNVTFIIGVLLPGLFLISYLFLYNLTTEFWNYYIVNNFEYSNRGLFSASPTWLLVQKNEAVMYWHQKIFVVPRLILSTKDTLLFFGSLILISVFGISVLLYKFKTISFKNKTVIAFIFLNIIFAYFSVIKSGNIFLHYILLLVIPATLLAGFFLGLIFEVFSQHRDKILKYTKYYFVVTVVIPVIIFAIDGNCYIRDYLTNYSHKNISNISAAIKKYTRPDDKLAVWGYLNSIYIESELIQATREPNSYLQITESPMQNYFTEKYCQDILTNKPPVFVDAVGKNCYFYYDYFQRYENFPAVKELINNNYVLKDTIDDVRIFVRKDK